MRLSAVLDVASFDRQTGIFDWTPSERQKGKHVIEFHSPDLPGPPRTVTIDVGPDSPVLMDLVSAATGIAVRLVWLVQWLR